MKHLILGDTHGRTIWKDIVAKESFDKIVFIGDYFDTHEGVNAEQQCNNFLDIIAYSKANPGKVIMLIGNHDFHYMGIVNERYSGYQYGAASQIKYLLESNKDYLQMAYQVNETTIATHAGISKTWLNKQRFKGDSVEQTVNDLWRYTPSVFKFEGSDPYGDSFVSSPIWIRPNSLSKDGIDMNQIVGHTMVQKINLPEGDRAEFWMIDALGTSREYLVVEDGVITIGKL